MAFVGWAVGNISFLYYLTSEEKPSVLPQISTVNILQILRKYHLSYILYLEDIQQAQEQT